MYIYPLQISTLGTLNVFKCLDNLKQVSVQLK